MTTTITAAAPDIESLVRDYYIDSSRFIYYDDYYDNTKKQQHQQEWSNEEHDDNDTNSSSYRYCDICRHHKTESSKRYYTDKGKNRQVITICTECLRRYQQVRYELFGFRKPTGVIAISVKSRVECLIMCA